MIWDLDNTIWSGVSLEGSVRVREHVAQTIRELDRRGVLQSVASRGIESQALKVLREARLADHFLCPRVNWLPKANNIASIAADLNLPLDSIVFVDDDPFEREQASVMLPGILAISPEGVAGLLTEPDFSPASVTAEAKSRRASYSAELDRRSAEQKYPSREAFLSSCQMTLSIRPMKDGDVDRVAELMVRTHQLNSTGLVLSVAELAALTDARAEGVRIYVARLKDRFGDYGLVGMAFIESTPGIWRLRFFALSCRVMGRGIERAFIGALAHHTATLGDVVEALLRDTQSNRLVRTMYQMLGFSLVSETAADQVAVFRADRVAIPVGPSWVQVDFAR